MKRKILRYRVNFSKGTQSHYPNSYNYRQGIEQGRTQGKGEGKAIEFMDTVEKLKESLSVPLEEVLRLLGRTMEDYVNAQKLLK